MRLRRALLVVLVVGGASALLATSGTIAAAVDPHQYFNALIARPDVFKAYSLRPRAGEPQSSPYYEKQFARQKDGGYTDSNSEPLGITFDATADAASVRIPAFTLPGTFGIGTLTGAVDATQDRVTITGGYGPLYNYNGRAVKLDGEILVVTKPTDGVTPAFDRTTGVLYVKRGQFGTTPAAHSAGATAHLSINTVPTALYLPLGTSDGHTYFVTWDGLWTDSYLKSGLTNHKAFNFLSSAIWLEPNTFFAGGSGQAKVAGFNPSTDVAAFQTRMYNSLGGPALWDSAQENYAGPNVTAGIPISPQLHTFTIKPNRWTRFFVRIEQRPNDYDPVSVWIADSEHDPVQILDRAQLSVRKGRIDTFVLEFNTSTDTFVRGDLRDLVAYVRNVVALQDPGDVTGLLQRPNSDVVLPSPPRNLRIVPGQ